MRISATTSRVVHDNIDPPEPVVDRREERLHRFRIGDIDRTRHPADRVRDRRSRLTVEISHHHGRTGLREPGREPFPDAIRRAGHQRHLSGQIETFGQDTHPWCCCGRRQTE